MVVSILVAAVSITVAIETIPLAALVMEGLVVKEVAMATLVAVATTTHHQ
jgi:hypothetical protein